MVADSSTESHRVTRRRVKVGLSKDKLAANIILSKPDPSEPPLSVDEVLQALAEAGVAHGIDEGVIREAIDESHYGQPILVASGDPMQRGQDTQFEHLFETEQHHCPVEGEDGRIDYRNMNFIQNVTNGSVLVRRIPHTDGVPGITVTGEQIPAPRGKDIPFRQGDNTVVSEDGSELLANADGAVVWHHGIVSVKDVLVIDGDVDFKVGNIDSVGSLKVTGKIHAGFEIRCGGNLEVNGNVEDCLIKTGGNIMVRGGFFGSGEGSMTAEGDITVKYAQNQKLSAGGTVVVGGELVNCQVTAKERVIVQGRKGKIVGGETNAGKEIRASVIGSDAGTATVLTVAYDAGLMRRYHEATHEIERVNADSKRVKETLYGLYKLQMGGKLDAQQEQALAKLEQFQKNVPSALQQLEESKTEVEAKIRRLKDARVVAEKAIFPGVKVHIGVLIKEMEQEHQACVLAQDGLKVQLSKYDPEQHRLPTSKKSS